MDKARLRDIVSRLGEARMGVRKGGYWYMVLLRSDELVELKEVESVFGGYLRDVEGQYWLNVQQWRCLRLMDALWGENEEIPRWVRLIRDMVGDIRANGRARLTDSRRAYRQGLIDALKEEVSGGGMR